MSKIRVLSVDDSALMRQIMTEIINSHSDMEMVATAPDPLVARDLIKKFNKEYNVDIENRKNVKKVERFEFIKALNIPLYMVSLKTDIGNEWLYYLVNGNTGKTLYERKVSEGDEISVIEEYLKSINKFEGKSSKDDPSTSILAEPHENGTYKKPEHGTAYTSQSELSKGKNIYQVYEGRYYTKPEWDEFYKTLSWLERLFIGKS